ncbi:MAG: helix-hairpin-helix domain-containing protein [Bacteroidales bacterium]|nr:helix-hairpin-helix domain-containing protein [Bacteroidales bacterium]
MTKKYIILFKAVKFGFTYYRKAILFITAIILSGISFCQNEKLSEIIINIAEDMASEESDPEAASLFIEQLQELADNPVRINSDDETEISRLFFLSDFQIKALANHVRSSGKIVSVYELAGIPGFDRQSAELVIPFISLEARTFSISDSIRIRNTLLSNLIFKPGEKDTASPGSPLKILTKYRFLAGHLEGGFTFEKDPGETFFTGSPPLPDFLSAHLAWSAKGIIRKIIVGDFAARFGQGTNINTGIRTAISLTAPGYMPGRDEIKAYTSTDENNYFRGAAAEFAFRKIGLLLFWSQNKIDAAIGSVSDTSMFFIENLYLSGLHNTSSSMLKRDALTENTYGMNFTCNFSSVKAGLSLSENRFSLPFNSEKENPEKLFDFEGTRNRIVSAYYNSLINRILLYGEFSMNFPRNFALIQGITLRPSDRLSINFLYRNYTPGFTTFHGNGPGSGSSTSNEQGLLGNFTFEAARHFFISAGCDISKHPWLRYRSSFPSLGKKEEIRLRYLPSEKITFDLSYYFRYSMYNNVETTGIAGVEENRSRTIKVQIKYSPNESLSAATRIDHKVAEPSGSKGTLLSQDLIWRCRQVPVTLWFRYCIFSTRDWDSRLYTYENDLLYSFSIPALSGEGSRSYAMLKWEVGDYAELRVKYSITSLIENVNDFQDRDEVKMQFRVWF